MLAYWFKWTATGSLGLAIGDDLHEIFWQIDSHGDPNDAKVKPATESASFCIDVEEDEDEQNPCSVTYPVDFERGWVKMKWPEDIHLRD